MKKILAITMFVIGIFGGELSAVQSDSTFVHNISLSASIEKSETPLNYPVKMKVIISWSGLPDKYMITDFQEPDLSNLTIVGSSSLSRTETSNGVTITVKEFEFGLKPIEIGMGYVDDISIGFTEKTTTDQDFLFTQRMELKGLSPEYPFDYSWIWKLALPFMIGIGIIFAGFRLNKIKAAKQVETEVEESLEEKYLVNLASITNQRSKPYKQKLGEVVMVFKHYLAHKFDIEDDIKNDLTGMMVLLDKTSFGEADMNKIKEIFDSAEKLRFSGADVNEDKFEMIYGSIESIIEKSKEFNK